MTCHAIFISYFLRCACHHSAWLLRYQCSVLEAYINYRKAYVTMWLLLEEIAWNRCYPQSKLLRELTCILNRGWLTAVILSSQLACCNAIQCVNEHLAILAPRLLWSNRHERSWSCILEMRLPFSLYGQSCWQLGRDQHFINNQSTRIT
jgi:hypothetical protein